MLMNRKDVRKVLVEWKGFLSEAKEQESSGPIIRIFDFDKTLVFYNNPDVQRVLGNPFIASFLTAQSIQKLSEDYAKTPEALEEIFKDVGPSKKNYIASKVGSSDFPKPTADKFISALQKFDSDANYKSLINVCLILKPSLQDWKRKLDKDDKAGLIADFNGVIDFGVEGIEGSNRLSADKSVRTQEEKIDQFLMGKGFEKFFTRPYVKANLAKTKEMTDDTGTTRNERIAGTSGKGPTAYTIAKNAFAEFPNSVINFEIYDNQPSNIAEMEDGILKASAGESYEDAQEEETKSEEQILAALKKILAQADNASVKKFQLVEGDKGYQVLDVTSAHMTKSKSGKGPKTEGGQYLLKYQKIQKKFFTLIKLLKSGGRAGAPSLAITVPLDIAFTKQLPDNLASNPDLSAKVQEILDSYELKPDIPHIYSNYIPSLASTGLEAEYSNQDKINELKAAMSQFIASYDKIKSAFEQIKNLIAASKTAKTPRAPGAAKATPKIPKAATPVAQPEPQQMQDQDYIRRLKRNIERADSAGDLEAADDLRAELDSYLEKETPSLKESLNRLRLVIKSK